MTWMMPSGLSRLRQAQSYLSTSRMSLNWWKWVASSIKSPSLELKPNTSRLGTPPCCLGHCPKTSSVCSPIKIDRRWTLHFVAILAGLHSLVKRIGQVDGVLQSPVVPLHRLESGRPEHLSTTDRSTSNFALNSK